MARRSRDERLGLEESDDGAAELTEVMGALAQAGRSPKPGITARDTDIDYRRLCRWLADQHFAVQLDDGTFDLSILEAASARDCHDRAQFPPSVFASWAIHLCDTSDATAHTLKGTLSRALRGLRQDGWATQQLGGRQDPGARIRTMVDGLRADQPRRSRRRARPVTYADLVRFFAALDDNTWGWTELAVEAQRTWLLTTWTVSFRGGESVYRLRWSMVDLTAGAECVVVPAGILKTNTERLELPIPHHSNCVPASCVALCPVHRLRCWREVCDRHGVPTDSAALVFPSVRNYRPGKAVPFAEWRLKAAFGDEAFIADPLAVGVAAAAAVGHDQGVAEGVAAKRLYSQYMVRWDKVKVAAGFGARNPFEGGGTHGLRRGSMQEALDNGASLVEVSQRAGHASLEMTGVYIDQVVEDTTELFEGLDQQTIQRVTEFPTDHPEPAVSCEIDNLGAPCGRDRTNGRIYRIVVYGEVIAACSTHYRRYSHGKTGDELTRPLRARVSDHAAACEIGHYDIPCGRDRADGRLHAVPIDGVMVTLCSGHYRRHRDGKTGNDFTCPIGTSNRKVAENEGGVS